MRVFKWVLGGLAGGAVGAAVWAGVAYATNYEIGWIAWGVGFLTGLGVRLAAQEADGFGPGVIAAVLALLAVGAGKYLAVHLAVEHAFGSLSAGVSPTTDADVISEIAREVAGEYAKARKRVKWPAGVNPDEASEEKDFPKEVWAEARKRWEARPQAERDAEKRGRDEKVASILQALKGQVRGSGFERSFGPLDLLWAFLAVGTAFRLGSGLQSGD